MPRMAVPDPETQGINTMRERSLHAALKQWVMRPGDRLEIPVEGFVIDVVRDDLLIEVQTGSFGALKRKLERLLPLYPVQIVAPIAKRRTIVKIRDGMVVSRRKSPKKGTIFDVFAQLVYITPFLMDQNLSIAVLMIEDEEIRLDDGKGSWRRGGWSIDDRRLVTVIDEHTFSGTDDYLAILEPLTVTPFTTTDVAAALGIKQRIAQKMLYCLRHIDAVEVVGKQGRSIAYRRVSL